MSEKHLGKLTVREFFARFPDEEACLTHIMEVRYGLRHECKSCGKYRTFHKVKGRPAFNCAECRTQVHPCAGTIFQDSRTPLQVWFYAIYLFVTTRHGVSGKELERTLGVTYKTAWRMGQQIRLLMAAADGLATLKGHVELDEAFIGGYRPGGYGAIGKTIVMGLKERGGRMTATTIPDTRMATLRDVVLRNVEKGSAVSTDEAGAYSLLKRDGYDHKSVNHSKKEWRKYNYRRNEYHHTNHVESFWRLFKDSIRSTHIHVSPKYMDRYLGEFTFRSNHRAMTNAMFDFLIAAV
ncbi:MAG: IS1595 family transposase [Rhizobiales bacterium]|nr:IS1595 family transposase [Hyphomicrobiales bacterium]